jgi:hypothetical protein
MPTSKVNDVVISGRHMENDKVNIVLAELVCGRVAWFQPRAQCALLHALDTSRGWIDTLRHGHTLMFE